MMKSDLEKKLINELGKTIVDISNLNDSTQIDKEIEKLHYYKKKNGTEIMAILIISYLILILLFVMEYFDLFPSIKGFFKGFLVVSLLWGIIKVYYSRREYDKEIFILNLLKENKNKD